jgi:hypothetical protein
LNRPEQYNYDSVCSNKSSAGASGGNSFDTDLGMEVSDNEDNDNIMISYQIAMNQKVNLVEI